MNEFATAVTNIPSEIAAEWRASHTRTEWLRAWEEGQAPTFHNSYGDYLLWLLLGKVSDTILILLVAIALVSIGFAFGG